MTAIMSTEVLIPRRLADLKHKMETREARIGIIGMGYVGLPLALLFGGERFRVTGFDIAPEKVKTLNAGESYILRILPEAIREAQNAGFRATSDYAEIARMDAVIICVPTPLDRHHEPDLSYVTGTVQSIAPHIHEDQLIVLESTTYPGTTEEIVVPILEAGNPSGLKVARTPGERACLSPFPLSARTRGIKQWLAMTFPRLWAAAALRLQRWPRPCTEPSSAAS